MRYVGSRSQHIAAAAAVIGCFSGIAITRLFMGGPESWLHIGISGAAAAGCVALVLDRLLPGRNSRRNVQTPSE